MDDDDLLTGTARYEIARPKTRAEIEAMIVKGLPELISRLEPGEWFKITKCDDGDINKFILTVPVAEQVMDELKENREKRE